jgi:hypothetical protein
VTGLDLLRAALPGHDAFVVRAVRDLAGEVGVRQFLDLGSGVSDGPLLHAVVGCCAATSRGPLDPPLRVTVWRSLDDALSGLDACVDDLDPRRTIDAGDVPPLLRSSAVPPPAGAEGAATEVACPDHSAAGGRDRPLGTAETPGRRVVRWGLRMTSRDLFRAARCSRDMTPARHRAT